MTYICPDCKGAKRVECYKCTGAGILRCDYCDGDGVKVYERLMQ